MMHLNKAPNSTRFTAALVVVMVIAWSSCVPFTASAQNASLPNASLPGATPMPVMVVDQKAADKIRAAYLYSFTRYVSWQDRSNENFRIAVVGNVRLGKLLEKIATKKKFSDQKSGKKVAIEVASVPTTLPTGHFDLVFVGSQLDRSLQASMLESLRDSGSFVVLDATSNPHNLSSHNPTPNNPAKSFASTARFVLQDGRVKFELNLEDANQRNLTLDAKLLRAASFILPQRTASNHL